MFYHLVTHLNLSFYSFPISYFFCSCSSSIANGSICLYPLSCVSVSFNNFRLTNIRRLNRVQYFLRRHPFSLVICFFHFGTINASFDTTHCFFTIYMRFNCLILVAFTGQTGVLEIHSEKSFSIPFVRVTILVNKSFWLISQRFHRFTWLSTTKYRDQNVFRK